MRLGPLRSLRAATRTGLAASMALSRISLAASVLLVGIVTAAVAPPSAHAQAIPPDAPIDGLIVRAAGWQPLPRPAPTLSGSFARGCAKPDPELDWSRLPQPLRDVPLDAMIGQLLVVSFTGTAPGQPGVAAARAAIAASRIGGLIYFRHNVGTGAELAAINAAFLGAAPFRDAGVPLVPLLAIDQEGGAVMRVGPTEGAPATPSARDLAAAPVADARAAYARLAGSLARLGFTVNFGPVVDLAVNPDNPVIAKYGRSYGADPATVKAYAEAFVAAHRAAGLATAPKHFPGHGSSGGDSHDGAIDLSATWRRVELAPFRDLVADGAADMVMTGHLRLAKLTGAGDLPASLSPDAIGFLRETLCFAGVVVSDDLAMEAIGGRYSPAEAVRLMLEADADVALLSLAPGTDLSAVDAIVAEVAAAARASPALADHVRHAFARVAKLKLTLAARRPGVARLVATD